MASASQRGRKAKCWVFVYAHYPDDVQELLGQRGDCFTFLIAGKRYDEREQRRKLEGYVVFKCQKRLSFVESLINFEGRDDRIIASIAKGSAKQNIRKCRANREWFELGENPYGNANEDGDDDTSTLLKMRERRMTGAGEEAMIEEFGESWLTHNSTIDNSIRRQRVDETKDKLRGKFENTVLRPWQSRVLQMLRSQGPRRIMFVVDEAGNTGKTFLGKYILATKEAIYLSASSTKDAAFAWNGERYVVFDFTREQSEKICYSSIESMKNGIVFSPKYRSETKIFSIPIIVCMMNCRPLARKMSRDRYQIVILKTSPDPLDNIIEVAVEDWRYAEEPTD